MKNFRIGIAVSLIAGLLNFVVQTPLASAAAGDIDTVMTVDGSTNYAMVGDSANVELGNSFTVELWVNPSDITSTTQDFIVKENSYLFGMYAGYFAYALFGSGNWSWESSGVKAAKDAWQHVAFTRAAGQNAVNVYVNGKLAYAGSANYLGTGTPADNTSNVYFGARSYNNNGTMAEMFTGKMDEIKIWNTVRTATQIQSDMNNWGAADYTNLKQYYDFNDISGTSVLNKVPSPGTGTTLTLVNSPTISTVDSTVFSAGKTFKIFPKSYLTSNGGFKIPTTVSNLQALLVAGGGGGGGYYWAGGGGSGGVVYDSSYAVTPDSNLPIAVGGGGFAARNLAGASNGNRAGDGADTWIGTSSFAAKGGGGGAGYAYNTAGSNSTGNAGGSSGGGSEQMTGSTISSPAITQTTPIGADASYGNVGGDQPSAPTVSYAGSGGGGAGSTGGSSSLSAGGAGGSGFYNALTDAANIGVLASSHYYVAGGGGGGGNSSIGTVSAGGGSGGYASAAASSGKPLTGGGGGGAYNSFGTSGGSGVVILSYLNYFGTSVSISVNPKKTTKSAGATPITATTTSTGTVTFYANGRVINGCLNVAVSGTTATCNWRPITQGQVTLTATYTSNDVAYAGSASAPAFVTTVGKRTSAR
jgi:hypothetical protein